MMQKLQLFISTCNKINMYANNSVINSNASLSFNIRLPTQAKKQTLLGYSRNLQQQYRNFSLQFLYKQHVILLIADLETKAT